VWAATRAADLNIRQVAITDRIVERFGDPALAALRDPWDRLIVATALELSVPLVTADGVMHRMARPGVLAVVW